MERLRSNLNHLRFRYKLFTEKHLTSNNKLALTGDSALYMSKEPRINASFGNISEEAFANINKWKWVDQR